MENTNHLFRMAPYRIYAFTISPKRYKINLFALFMKKKPTTCPSGIKTTPKGLPPACADDKPF